MISLREMRLTLLIMMIPLALIAQEEQPAGFYWADTVMVVGEKDIRIPQIGSIATKMVVPLHKTPASVGVVTRSIFENQNGTTLRDAMKNVSGVNVQNGLGTHDFFLIRGYESLSGGLVLTDGAPEPEVSFYNLYNIERIETLKGPSSFLYGSNPLSGAVNLVRKQPVFANFAQAHGSYGEFNTFRGTFDVGLSNPASNLAVRINGLWQDSQNYRDRKDNHSYAINPALKWKIDGRSSLTANLEFVKSDYQPDSGLPIEFDSNFMPVGVVDVPRTRSYQTPLDDSDQEMYRGRLDYVRDLSESISVRNKFYFTQLNWASLGTLISGAFPSPQTGGLVVSRVLNGLDDRQRFIGNQLEATFAFNVSSFQNNLLTGVEFMHLSDEFEFMLATPDPFQGHNLALNIGLDRQTPPESITNINAVTFDSTAIVDARSMTIAPYFLNRLTLSEQVEVFFGGRFDVIDYEDDREEASLDIPSGTFATQSFGVRDTYTRFSPMVGMTVQPTEVLTLYANAGQSFSPPSTFAPRNPDDPEALQPEESRQYEAGIKLQSPDGRLRTSVAAYHLERENIEFVSAQNVRSQIGSQRSRGIEFELAAEPARGLTAFLSYAYTDAELTKFSAEDELLGLILDRSGNRPAFVPEHIFNVWAIKQFRNGLGLGAGIRYLSDQYIHVNNDIDINGYVTFDASVSYTFKNFRWGLNIKNITDRDYETRGFNQFSVTPANPRAIYGSFDVSL